MFKIGLIVNPIAGMGGKVGLKGTDGCDILEKAIALGARKESVSKTVKTLSYLAEVKDSIKLLTCSGEMGQSECIEADIPFDVVYEYSSEYTTDVDTELAALKMIDQDVNLILFAGGDGTARSVYKVVENRVPVLGIPTGVKIHSAVFAKSPVDAGRLVAEISKENAFRSEEREVMDIDEEALRDDKVMARLYGYMNVPCSNRYTQSLKSSSASNQGNLLGISRYVIDHFEEDCYYIVGAGTTTRKILEDMGEEFTLIGIDVIKNGKLIIKDAGEKELLQLSREFRCKIIISPIGGQGFLFGRGNQQMSAEVIRNVGKENIIIIATPEKMMSIFYKPFLVDTGDERTDEYLKGIYKVIVGYDRFYVWRCE